MCKVLIVDWDLVLWHYCSGLVVIVLFEMVCSTWLLPTIGTWNVWCVDCRLNWTGDLDHVSFHLMFEFLIFLIILPYLWYHLFCNNSISITPAINDTTPAWLWPTCMLLLGACSLIATSSFMWGPRWLGLFSIYCLTCGNYHLISCPGCTHQGGGGSHPSRQPHMPRNPLQGFRTKLIRLICDSLLALLV